MSTPQSSDRRRIFRQLLVASILVVTAYLIAVTVALITDQQRPVPEIDRVGGTRVTLTAQTPDGAPLDAAALGEAQQTIGARVRGLGITDAQVDIAGDTLTVAVPGDAAALADIGRPGRLVIRPVLRTVPAAPAGAQPEPADTLGERIAAAKQLRQSTDPARQAQALTQLAQRCEPDDVLAGADDPTLPLVTCATDGQSAYLLAPAIIGGDQIKNASAQTDPDRGANVDLVFKPEAATTWADFTAAHVGDQVAFTLDSQVLSASIIAEPIPGGRIQIGGDFTEAQARELATVVNRRPLPVPFAVTATEPVPPAPEKSVFAAPEFGLIGIGVVLMIGLIGGLVFASMRGGGGPE